MLSKIKNLFSNKKFSTNITATLKRFPLTSLALLISTLIFIWIANEFPFLDKNLEEKEAELIVFFAVRLALTTTLAAFFLTSVKIFLENKSFSFWQKSLTWLLSLAALTLFFFWLPEELKMFDETIKYHQLIIFFLTTIPLLLSAPFIKKDRSGFWKFNQLMARNFALSLIIGATLFAGLALSLSSVAHLFNLKFAEEIYFSIWIALASGVIPFFYLTILPSDWKSLIQNKPENKLIRNFGYFILLPLLTVYFAILASYGIKIMLTHDWPKGVVASMVLGYATAGLLTMMIIHPFRKLNRLTKAIPLIFHLTLIPLIGLLMASFHQRVAAYGWTPMRALAVLLAIWFLLMALYFIFSRKKDLRLVHFSLVILLLVSHFAPWNIFTFSANSQFKRLEKLLIEKKILLNGKITHQKVFVTEEEYDQIEDSFKFLFKMGQLERVSPWFENKSIFDYKVRKWETINLLMRDLYLKIEKVGCEDIPNGKKCETENTYQPFANRTISYRGSYQEPNVYSLDDKNSDFIVTNLDSKELAKEKKVIKKTSLKKFYLFHADKKIIIKENVEGELKIVAEKDLSDLITALWDKKEDGFKPQDMVVVIDSEQYQITLIIDDFTVKNESNLKDRAITSLEAIMLIKRHAQ